MLVLRRDTRALIFSFSLFFFASGARAREKERARERDSERASERAKVLSLLAFLVHKYRY
jgi:uncharacterized membrane protein